MSLDDSWPLRINYESSISYKGSVPTCYGMAAQIIVSMVGESLILDPLYSSVSLLGLVNYSNLRFIWKLSA